MTERKTITLSQAGGFDYWTAERISGALELPSPPVDAAAERMIAIVTQSEFASLSTGGEINGTDDGFPANPGGEESDLTGQPKPVTGPTYYPWRNIGRLSTAWIQENVSYYSAAVVVGETTILSSANIYSAINRPPDSAVFTPAYSWSTGTATYDAPFGDWLVESLDVADGYRWGRDYWDYNVFHDYALATLSSNRRVFGSGSAGSGATIRQASLASILKQGGFAPGYLDIDTDYLPRDANASGAIKLTCVGYPIDLGGGYRMYRQTQRYIGSYIKKIPGRQGNTPKGYSMYQGRHIPSDAVGLQLINSSWSTGGAGAPILRQVPGAGRYAIVGLNAGGGGLLGMSPTFSSAEFRSWLRRHQQRG